MSSVDRGDVQEVLIQGHNIQGKYKNGERFRTFAPTDPELVKSLREKNVKIAAKPEDESPWYMVLLLNWFPMLLLIGVWIFFMRQMQVGGGKAMSFGKSRAKLLTENQHRVTFSDVAGVDEAKDDLQEIIAFLKDPKKFTKLGGRIPKGCLLVGPPGTGKTLLARAIAGEAGVPFFSISGSDFVEMFVGVGASRVRDLFVQGKKNAPCIIFIDEIDAVGRHRVAGLGGGHDEREQTLNQLLVEMDGVEMGDFELAKDKVMMGAERRSMIISLEERRNTAYHESGHALVAKLLPGADPVHKVTIIPRGMALGLTQQIPLDDRHTHSKAFLVDNLAILFGGRAAEELVLGHMTTGAGNDIERATELAHKMVCEWGMSEKLGPMTFGKKEEEIFLGRDFTQRVDYSETTAVQIDTEVRRIIMEAYEHAKLLLRRNVEVLHKMAEALLEREVLDGAEIDEILRQYGSQNGGLRGAAAATA